MGSNTLIWLTLSSKAGSSDSRKVPVEKGPVRMINIMSIYDFLPSAAAWIFDKGGNRDEEKNCNIVKSQEKRGSGVIKREVAALGPQNVSFSPFAAS